MTSPREKTKVFNPATPLLKEIISDSQVSFLDNFKILYDIFKNNHIALDATTNAGNHTIVQLLQQPENSDFQTDAGEISVYTKNVEGQTDQIFLRYQGNQEEFQYTNYQIYEISSKSKQTFFFTFLPGKIIAYFGVIKPKSNTFQLELKPRIAKNIIGANYCALGQISSFIGNNTLPIPYATGLVETSPGIYGEISLIISFPNPKNIPEYSYLVFANV